ncbi:hypothetical protein ACWGKW_41595 [Streptomyces sp. NPDC054766]|uniref:hypothetical protein n=1 Tax=Streptomyces rhizosphaerihabitans TaxID=1266770 RepID=UPI0021BF2FC9|nr:hypothetical protein [Streptomyces rhizosphaerihabitans]MCT9004114.1 hypothetical protein [Streptomyces rhizosphaerihabitans]
MSESPPLLPETLERLGARIVGLGPDGVVTLAPCGTRLTPRRREALVGMLEGLPDGQGAER